MFYCFLLILTYCVIMTVCACGQTPACIADLQLRKCHRVLRRRSWLRKSPRTFTLWTCPSHCLVGWNNSAFLFNLGFNLFFTIFSVFDHIPEQKYFHDVNDMFKWFAVLPTLLNGDVNAEHLPRQARGSWYILPCLMVFLAWILRVAICIS